MTTSGSPCREAAWDAARKEAGVGSASAPAVAEAVLVELMGSVARVRVACGNVVSDNTALPQFRQAVGTCAQPVLQDFGAVLAQQRRWQVDAHRRGAELHRTGHQIHRVGQWVGPGLDHGAVLHVGVGENFGQVVDGAAGHLGGFQRREPVGFARGIS